MAHTDKAAIAGGVCPVDGTGSGVIIFLEPVPKRFPRFGIGSPAYLFSKDIEQALRVPGSAHGIGGALGSTTCIQCGVLPLAILQK
jgi:hypothetical protein